MEIEKQSLQSMDVANDNKEKLKQLFPSVFVETTNAEGELVETIDVEKLKAEIGTFSDIYDNRKERYGLDWPGKKDALKIIQKPSIATLKPVKDEDESVNFDETENLFIEGDNLEVLKLLQKSYYGKIKMIYIDPPYNTGKEFIYPDNYTESLDTYLAYAGLADEDGRKFSTNTQNEGRYHTNWLNMMYPRLYLAKNLLRDDGVIFISIDDNEVTNLRKLCDEVFGEDNFISNIVWEKRYTRNNDAKLMSSLIEHILLYRKSDKVENLREPRTEKANSIYSNPDDDPRGPWTSVSYVSQRTKEQRPNLSYSITNPINNQVVEHPVNAWKYSFSQHQKHVEENRLYWGIDGANQFPRLKRFLSELPYGIVPVNLWNYKETGTVDDGTKEVNALIGKDIFEYPKPHSLIKRMLKMVTVSNDNDIVLDFFAGSATTAHAVLELNKEDGGNRKFIMVQLPEPCEEKSEAYQAGYKTIADIGKDRIRRVIKKIEDKQREALDKAEGAIPGFAEEPKEIDLGFKVFKLDKSNFKIWDGSDPDASPEEIIKQLDLHIDHVDANSSKDDILYEILLKAGFMLTEKVEEIELAGKTVYSVSDGSLLICLEDEITRELIDELAKAEPKQIICLDQSFKRNDELKANAMHTFSAQNEGKESSEQIIFRTV